MYRKMAMNLDEQLHIQRQTQEELEEERRGLIKLIKEMNDEVIIQIKEQKSDDTTCTNSDSFVDHLRGIPATNMESVCSARVQMGHMESTFANEREMLIRTIR